MENLGQRLMMLGAMFMAFLTVSIVGFLAYKLMELLEVVGC